MHHKKSNFKPPNRNAALALAQNICSQQERCCSEIRKKLQQWQLSEKEQEEILSSLIEDKFINENRYADFFTRDKLHLNKWGRIKIAYQLRIKEIPEEIITEALSNINTDEYRKVLEKLLSQKQLGLKEDNPYKLKDKLVRFARGRGFELEQILEAINKLVF